MAGWFAPCQPTEDSGVFGHASFHAVNPAPRRAFAPCDRPPAPLAGLREPNRTRNVSDALCRRLVPRQCFHHRRRPLANPKICTRWPEDRQPARTAPPPLPLGPRQARHPERLPLDPLRVVRGVHREAQHIRHTLTTRTPVSRVTRRTRLVKVMGPGDSLLPPLPAPKRSPLREQMPFTNVCNRLVFREPVGCPTPKLRSLRSFDRRFPSTPPGHACARPFRANLSRRRWLAIAGVPSPGEQHG